MGAGQSRAAALHATRQASRHSAEAPAAAAAARGGGGADGVVIQASASALPSPPSGAVERDAKRAADAERERHRHRRLSLEEEEALEAEDAALGGMLARLGGSIVAQTRVPGVLPPERERETAQQAVARRAAARDAAAREGLGRLPPPQLRELFEMRARAAAEEESRTRRRIGGDQDSNPKQTIVPQAALPMLARHGVSVEAASRALSWAALPRVRPTQGGMQAARQAAEQAQVSAAAGTAGPGDQRRRLALLLQQYPWLREEQQQEEEEEEEEARRGGEADQRRRAPPRPPRFEDGEEIEAEAAAAPGVLGVASWPAWWERRAQQVEGTRAVTAD